MQTIEALRKQFESDLREVSKLRDEQESLRESYQRFRDLEEQLENRSRRLVSAGALVVAHSKREEVEKQLSDAGVHLSPDWRKNVPLWRVIREVVRQYKQVQVVTVCQMLSEMDFAVTRQGVESALRTHASVFRITRRGREKYVSLK